MNQQQALQTVFDSANPFWVLVAAGGFGGLIVVLYQALNGYLSGKSLIHIAFGIAAALLAGTINLLPGNAQFFFNGLVAGFSGVTLIQQYVQRTEGGNDIIKAAREQSEAIKQLERHKKLFEQLETVFNAKLSPELTLAEIAKTVQDYAQTEA